MAGRKEKYDPEKMAKALTKCKGMVTVAAREIGCDVGTMQAYIKKYKLVAAAKNAAHEALGDAVELALHDKAIVQKETAALIFLAKTKYKDRGYTERVEATGAGGGPLQVQFTLREVRLPPVPEQPMDEFDDDMEET